MFIHAYLMFSKKMSTQTQTSWAIDNAHSEILFKVRHMMMSNVTGYFSSFEGSLHTANEDFSDAKISFSANIDSINTNNQQRDEHLKSDDFFNADAYPKMTFESSSFTKVSDDTYKLVGELTLREVTKTVELDVVYNGTAVDPYGQTKAGFEIEGKISRKEFNLKWNALTEAGSVVVSDEVRLNLNVQLTKQ